jgi:cytochrome c-type biogenesis protein CcmE
LSETDSRPVPSAAGAPARRRNKWLAFAALVIAAAAFLIVTFGGIGQNLVYYWGPTELKAAAERAVGATIRLGGLVAPGSVVRGPGVSGVEFDVVDRKGARVHVRSKGVPPQMFREGIGVVVEGRYDGGLFTAERLMVKHSNEYHPPKDGKPPHEMPATLMDDQAKPTTTRTN